LMGDDYIPRFFFFGQHISAVLVSLLHELPLLFFVFIAVVRKMRHERAYASAKPYAVLLFVAISLLLIGDIWPVNMLFSDHNNIPPPGVLMIVLFCMIVLGILLVGAVSPNAGDILKGIRHAGKLGFTRVLAWSDLSVNWAPVLSMSVIVLLAGTIVTTALHRTPIIYTEYGSNGDTLRITNGIVATLVAALTVLFFGMMKQYFDLHYKKNAMSYFALLLFCLWLVPVLLAIASAIFTHGISEDISKALLSISPLGGIGLIVADAKPCYLSLFIVGALTLFSLSLYISAVRSTRRAGDSCATRSG